jgi:hypothetical protein
MFSGSQGDDGNGIHRFSKQFQQVKVSVVLKKKIKM